MPTQAEIARRLKISQITVSRALRGENNVTAELRERILAHAEKVGYAFHEGARSLARGKTGRIGVVIPDKETFENRYFNGVLMGLTEASNAAGVGLLFLDMSRMSSVSDLRRGLRRADGFVIRNCGHMWPWLLRLVDTVRSLDKPYVLVQGNRSESGPALAVDDALGAVKAVTYLHELGHRRIAFQGGATSPAGRERLTGYLEGLRLVGLPAREDLVSHQCEPDEGRFLDRLWAMPPGDRPTALFAWSDLIAINELYAAASRGIRVPADLSVVGFSDFVLFPTLFRPHLTTLHVPAAEVGNRALELVMDPPSNPHEHVELLEPTLTIRESAAPPGGTAGDVAPAAREARKDSS